MRSTRRRASRRTAMLSGSRRSVDQAPQPGPCSSLSAAKRPHRSRSDRAAAVRPSAEGWEAPPSAGDARHSRSSAAIFKPADLRSHDRGRGVQGSAGPRQRRQLGGQEAVAGNVLDRQVERVAEASRARVVGARLGIRGRIGRAERADQQRAGAQCGRPGRQPPQVGQVTHPPARPRACGIQLHRPAPGAPAAGQRAAWRRHQQQLLLPATTKAVIAVRHVARDGAHRPQLRPVLQDQLAARRQPIAAARHTNHASRALSFAGLELHRRQHRPARGGWRDSPPAPGVGPGRLDRPDFPHPERGRRKSATERAAMRYALPA